MRKVINITKTPSYLKLCFCFIQRTTGNSQETRIFTFSLSAISFCDIGWY